MKRGLFSEYDIKIPSGCKNRVMSLILENSLSYKYTKIEADKTLIIVIKKRHKKAFEALLKSNNIDAEYVEIKGYLSFFEDLRGRVGLLIGFIFIMLALNYSSKVVWKIEIDGNSSVSSENILNQLSEAGLNLGTYIPDIDYDTLHNRVLLSSDNLSWLSVNITGNVAKVSVKEKISQEEKSSPLYTNVVAKNDGYIASVIVINGKKVVSVGDVVREGEVLISGVINSQSQGVRYEHASGEIKAYVNKEIKIKIPFSTTKKVYTGNRYTEKSYKIYNFPINFSSKYGNQSLFYDTIEKKEKLCFMGISRIPLETVTTVYYEYELVPVTLTVNEAVDQAFIKLREQMDLELKNAELISKNVKTSYDKDYFYIDCQLYCLEDIAKEQEFYVTD